MRLIHGEGFSRLEREGIRLVIFENIISGAQALIEGVQELRLHFADDGAQAAAQIVTQLELCPGQLEPQWVHALRMVWSDSTVQAAYQRRMEFEEALPDSTAYFLNNLERISQRDYLPTDQDILYSRNPTRSILEYPFDLDRVTYNIVDVGGQRSERRKWIYCFEGVTSVIFIAAISEYDLNVTDPYSRRRYNGLQESIALFEQLLRHPAFLNSSFILFLNKSDIFEEKVLTSNIIDHFPEYSGPRRDAQRGAKFFEELFLSCVPQERRNRAGQADEPLIYVYATTATNTENIRHVFAAVKDTVLNKFLRSYTFF